MFCIFVNVFGYWCSFDFMDNYIWMEFYVFLIDKDIELIGSVCLLFFYFNIVMLLLYEKERKL